MAAVTLSALVGTLLARPDGYRYADRLRRRFRVDQAFEFSQDFANSVLNTLKDAALVFCHVLQPLD
jgi:hypothetical protein